MPTQAPDLAPYRAQPDAPITAIAWNALRSAILGAYELADALTTRQGYITVIVRERASDALVPAAQIARVVAQPEGAANSELPVVRLGARYFIGPLDPGLYRVTVTPSAGSGFVAQTRPACVISGQPAEVTFFLAPPAPGRVRVPDLFGLPLQQALNVLEASELRPGRMMDSHGRAVTVTDTGRLGGGFLVPDPVQAASPVLSSEPGEGMDVDRGSLVHLLIAAQRAIPPVERITVDLNLPDPIASVDPARAATPSERAVTRQLFQGLVGRDPETGQIGPGLAASWSVDEAGTAWTFVMRAGLDWARLDPAIGVVAVGTITAQDAACALRRALDPRTAAPDAAMLEFIAGAAALRALDPADTAAIEAALAGLGVEAVDDQTLRLTLAAPAEVVPDALAQPVAFPVPQAIVEAAGADWAQPQTIACSGPYVLAELSASQVTLRKNPLWHAAGPVQIEEIRFLRIADELLAFNSFLAGELDSVRVPQPRLEEMQANPDLSVLLHTAADESPWLSRPWLTRAYPMPGEELIYRWRLDWNAKKAARQRT